MPSGNVKIWNNLLPMSIRSLLLHSIQIAVCLPASPATIWIDSSSAVNSRPQPMYGCKKFYSFPSISSTTTSAMPAKRLSGLTQLVFRELVLALAPKDDICFYFVCGTNTSSSTCHNNTNWQIHVYIYTLSNIHFVFSLFCITKNR